MKPTNKFALGSIVVAHASVDMQTISLNVLLPGLLTTFGLNYATAAAIVTFNQIVIAISQPLFGMLGDKREYRWMILVGTALTGLAMVCVPWMPSYALVIVAVMFSGIGSAMFHPEGLANARVVGGDRKATANSIFFLGGNIGFGLGPLLAALLVDNFGPRGSAGMLLPTSIGCALLWSQRQFFARNIAARQVGAQAHTSTSNNRVTVLRAVAVVLILIVLREVVAKGLQAFLPLYYAQVDQRPASAIAPMLTTLSLSGIVGTLFSGALADRIGRRTVMVGAMAIATAALFVFLRTDGVVQLIAMAIAGVSLIAPWTLSVTMIQDAMPNNIGLAGGLSLGTAYGASGIGVGLLGVLANYAGLPFTLQFITLIPAVVLVLSLLVQSPPAPMPRAHE